MKICEHIEKSPAVVTKARNPGQAAEDLSGASVGVEREQVQAELVQAPHVQPQFSVQRRFSWASTGSTGIES